MNDPGRVLDRLAGVLHAPDAPPMGPAWNAADLRDLVPPAQPRIPAAVLVPLVLREGGLKVLLTRRTESLRHHAGQVSFPGGRIEAADGDPLRAALREAREEVGLGAEFARPIGFLDPFETITAYHVWPLVAWVAAGYRPVIDPGEVAEAFEVPLGFLLDPDNCRRVEVDYAGRPRHYYEFRYRHYRIWGATAAMLVNLREKLTGH
ncbi:8-oxo-dGTP pyrophosphatase MutT (NUDIX family) [Rehaibacterium terrae]|uniref:8-oxo-dGTP pyrophosphatase MutT (NUDIX family) n=1 Tax=Rehaibacterium terrae TaxID=1341696 RepID=A0A7W7Y006_9GAMM|nr:8-oxo-dGTP pyrophosphatase MutT (NUDIX family) [Rehaibacterium terrae]